LRCWRCWLEEYKKMFWSSKPSLVTEKGRLVLVKYTYHWWTSGLIAVPWVVLVFWLGELVEELQGKVTGIVLVHLTEARMILLCCVLICSSVIICFSLFFIASRISDHFLSRKVWGLFFVCRLMALMVQINYQVCRLVVYDIARFQWVCREYGMRLRLCEHLEKNLCLPNESSTIVHPLYSRLNGYIPQCQSALLVTFVLHAKSSSRLAVRYFYHACLIIILK